MFKRFRKRRALKKRLKLCKELAKMAATQRKMQLNLGQAKCSGFCLVFRDNKVRVFKRKQYKVILKSLSSTPNDVFLWRPYDWSTRLDIVTREVRNLDEQLSKFSKQL